MEEKNNSIIDNIKNKFSFITMFLKEIFSSFWNPNNKILKWFNRLFFIFCCFIFCCFNFLDESNNKKQLNDYQQNYALEEGNRSFYKQNYEKAKKVEKELNQQSNNKNTNSVDTLKKYRFCSLVYMAANPDLKLQPLSPHQMEELREVTDKNTISDKEKRFFLMYPLTSGQTDYFMNNWLIQSLSIKPSQLKIGFDLYSGSLFINKNDFNKLSKNQQKIILQRANEIFDASELSVRLPKGLQISYT